MADVDDAVARAHREEWARVVATLARRFGDLDVAEDATAEAFAVAVERWRADGVPPNPGAWLTVTAGNKALDRVRREGRRDDKQKQAPSLTGIKIFPGRSHWTLLDPGWEEVADYALDWAVRNQRTSAGTAALAEPRPEIPAT